MIRLCRESGYRGWYGIEFSGRDAISRAKQLFTKYEVSRPVTEPHYETGDLLLWLPPVGRVV